jgi:hypothetical protein
LKREGIYHDIKSKFFRQGIFNEEDAITLIQVDGIMYSKNDERRKNYTEGECDIFKDLVTKKVVHDTKCSWSAETFMAANH